MTFLLKRGAPKRVAHIAIHDRLTGEPTGEALCGIERQWPCDTSSNVPWGRRVCKNCRAVAGGFRRTPIKETP